ncbi:PfkB family carbohydrate kinase [Actinomadura nitritigenes]|uniref:PfkB family carbohydrate kinase n=1 Tax=Actinomadura nitritigenes TaxID=134602 RepID=UPI0036AFCE5C
MSGGGPDVCVVGQIARDLVLVVGEVPGPGGSARVRRRREMLGGKGANQAVGLAQLGMRPALAGVVGDDDAGRDALGQAVRDGIDVSAVVRREGARTGLIVDVVDGDGRWRHLEDLPPPVRRTRRCGSAPTSSGAARRWSRWPWRTRTSSSGRAAVPSCRWTRRPSPTPPVPVTRSPPR